MICHYIDNRRKIEKGSLMDQGTSELDLEGWISFGYRENGKNTFQGKETVNV